MIPFFITHIAEDANRRMQETLATTMISEGEQVRLFEQELETFPGVSGAVAVNSGTASLHLALLCGGIGPGDEVILPAQTFVASGLAILHAGARPVFADIQYHSGNLDPASVAEKITPRTRAIMPVHWAGYPADLLELQAIADAHGLWMIEDAAHALGAQYHGRAIGTLSRFTAFSFQAIKHVTTGDGGLLACIDQEDYAAARRRRWFGIDRAASRPSPLGEREYDLDQVGYKYHLNDLGATLGRANLVDLPAMLARRKTVAARYRTALTGLDGLTLLEDRSDRESAWWLFTFHVERRVDFIAALKATGVPASVVHFGIHKNSLFEQQQADLPAQQRFDETQVSIPVHQQLSDGDVEHIIATIHTGW